MAARPAPERAATLPAPAVGTSEGVLPEEPLVPVGVEAGAPGVVAAPPVGTTGTQVELLP